MTQKKPVLYSFRRCPYAIRARMALVLAGIDFELREINLRDKPSTFLATSPKGTVPVLVLPDGRVIDESLDIVDWVCEKNMGLITKNPEQYYDLLNLLDQDFRPASRHIKYPDRYPDVNLDQEHVRCQLFCQKLNAILEKQLYLHGEQPGQADCVIFSFVRQLYRVDESIIDGYQVPAVYHWIQRIIDADYFNDVMQKVEVWSA